MLVIANTPTFYYSSPMPDLLREEYVEQYPLIGARNWRYKQEVSAAVADHITDNVRRQRIAGHQIAQLLRNPPIGVSYAGTTRYCHPMVEKEMDWFEADIEETMRRYEEAVSSRPERTAILVNGWAYRYEFERLGGSEPLWITQAMQLPAPETTKRNSGQPSANLDVSVSASGMKNRSVGLFAEVSFGTENEYIDYSDVVILGKVDPDTGMAQTPYHTLSDNIFDREHHYRGCRPVDGTLFPANRAANFILGQLEEIS